MPTVIKDALEPARAMSFRVTPSVLSVELSDGRTIAVPLVWYPRLAEATPVERRVFEFTGDGYGIHWPLIDEDISVEALLKGGRSGESAASLERWRKEMERRRKDPNLHALPWGEERPLPDWWESEEEDEPYPPKYQGKSISSSDPHFRSEEESE